MGRCGGSTAAPSWGGGREGAGGQPRGSLPLPLPAGLSPGDSHTLRKCLGKSRAESASLRGAGQGQGRVLRGSSGCGGGEEGQDGSGRREGDGAGGHWNPDPGGALGRRGGARSRGGLKTRAGPWTDPGPQAPWTDGELEGAQGQRRSCPRGRTLVWGHQGVRRQGWTGALSEEKSQRGVPGRGGTAGERMGVLGRTPLQGEGPRQRREATGSGAGGGRGSSRGLLERGSGTGYLGGESEMGGRVLRRR